ncbi:MAG: hypothetical protein WHX52_14470 [Anaerolineae bacterium]
MKKPLPVSEMVDAINHEMLDGGSAALRNAAKNVEGAVVAELKRDRLYGQLWQRFLEDRDRYEPLLVGVLTVLLRDDAFVRRVEPLLAAYRAAR